MRILHLFSNWKWTGPAEPALNLAAELKKRGHEVYFASGHNKDGRSIIAERAGERDVPLIGGLRLSKHRGLLANPRDVKILAEHLRKNPVDVVHTHMDNDHAIAVRAMRKAKSAALLVRSLYAGGVDSIARRTAAVIRDRCDVLLALSTAVTEAAPETFGLPPERVRHTEGAIDTGRFSPRERKAETMRELGLDEDDFVVGIVARMQRHRRFEVFFRAVRDAASALPNLKALVIGRGTHAREVGHEEVERLDITRHVIFAGYHAEDYVDVANCMDVKVFLVPGSDGSCRAVRECMALGKPVIAAKRGMLPEIVDGGVTGIVLDDTVENLADAMVRLGKDKAKREEMGRAAAEKAKARFSLSGQAKAVEDAYKSVNKNTES